METDADKKKSTISVVPMEYGYIMEASKILYISHSFMNSTMMRLTTLRVIGISNNKLSIKIPLLN